MIRQKQVFVDQNTVNTIGNSKLHNAVVSHFVSNMYQELSCGWQAYPSSLRIGNDFCYALLHKQENDESDDMRLARVASEANIKGRRRTKTPGYVDDIPMDID